MDGSRAWRGAPHWWSFSTCHPKHKLLLGDPSQLYHGPVSGLGDYLASLGYVCPSYMALAE
jgi:hypothetical protein